MITKNSLWYLHSFLSLEVYPTRNSQTVVVVIKLLSRVQLFCDPMDSQAPLSMGFSRQEYWSGLPLPSSGDPPNPGIKPASPALQADSLPLSQKGSPMSDLPHFKVIWNSLYVKVLVPQSCPTLWGPHGLQPSWLPCSWDSPDKNTGVSCHPFSRRSSQPRDWIQVSCTAGDFFYRLSHQGI